MKRDIVTVTGAFGYAGSHIARKLIERGETVETLTNSPSTATSVNVSAIHALNFNDEDALINSLKSTKTLYNTYWLRFDHKMAEENSKKLLLCAKKAGVERIVHISITNADKNCQLPYFKEKGIIEKYIENLGVSYSIVRPAALFGHKDVMFNNIAWSLRNLPIMGIPGNGKYHLQPIHISDMADILISEGEAKENHTIVALGAERYTYIEMLKMVRDKLGLKTPLMTLPNSLAWLGAQTIGAFIGDKLLTWDEIQGFQQEKLWENKEPIGKTKLSQWVEDQKDTLGMQYRNEAKKRKS